MAMKRDTRSAYRRRAADTERMVDAAVAAVREERHREFEAAKQRAREREASRQRFTRADVVDAHHVFDGYRWYRVVRVNRDTVTVDSGHSWTERIRFDKIHNFADGDGFRIPVERP